MKYSLSVILTYGFLICAICALWVDAYKKRGISWSYVLLAVSALFGFYYRYLDAVGLGLIVGLIIILHFKKRFKPGLIFGLAIFFLGALLLLHKFPGFNNYNVISEQIVSKNGIPYSLYLNFDKALMGFFLLSFYNDLASSLVDWKKVLRTVFSSGMLIIVIVIGLSIFLGFVVFEPKIVTILPIWIITNLWFACVAEEAFFRMFIQNQFGNIFKSFKQGKWWALVLASITFGLAHFPGGIKYVFLATVAGFGYGYVYQKTQKIETAIMVHFLLNLVHIILFTYPALRTSF